MSNFKRENRYFVFKIKDVEAANSEMPIKEILESISRELPDRQYVVVESDWPEYEPVWGMIEARRTGEPSVQAQMADLKRTNVALRYELSKLLSIVKIHSEATGNNFAWAEVEGAEEVLQETENA